MFTAIDTETTGLQPGHNELIGIAVIPLTDDFLPDEQYPMFHTLVRPERPDTISVRALKVNGITMEELDNAPSRKDSLGAFAAWFSDTMGKSGQKILWPLAHNWAFDKAFINAWFDPNGTKPDIMSSFFHYHVRDTQAVAQYILDIMRVQDGKPQFSSTSLGSLCKAYNIINPQPHSAVGDALATAALYRRLVYNK